MWLINDFLYVWAPALVNTNPNESLMNIYKARVLDPQKENN